MEHEASNINQGPSMQKRDPTEMACQYHNKLVAKKPTLLIAETIFIQEQNVGLAQRSQILASIDDIYQLIQLFSALLRPPALPPNALNPQRHYLLIKLHTAEKLISQDLTPRINTFPTGYSVSATQVDARRREILRYLKSLIESLDELDKVLKPLLDVSITKLHSDDIDSVGTPVLFTDVQEVPNETQIAHQENSPPILEAESQTSQEMITQVDTQVEMLSIDDLQPTEAHPHHPAILKDSSDLPAQLSSFDYTIVDPVTLRKAINRAFKSADLELLCDDLGLDYNALKDGPVENKIKYIIEYFQGRNEYEKLIRKVLKERPHLEKELINII